MTTAGISFGKWLEVYGVKGKVPPWLITMVAVTITVGAAYRLLSVHTEVYVAGSLSSVNASMSCLVISNPYKLRLKTYKRIGIELAENWFDVLPDEEVRLGGTVAFYGHPGHRTINEHAALLNRVSNDILVTKRVCVNTSSMTKLSIEGEPASLAHLPPGRLIEVRGALLPSGRIIAKEVQVLSAQHLPKDLQWYEQKPSGCQQ